MDSIQINFINKSNNQGYSNVVIFQKNVAANFDEMAVAWKVIQSRGRNDDHPFTYPLDFDVAGSDSYGNYTPKLKAFNGQAFDMVSDDSGDVLKLSRTPSTRAEEVEVRNQLSTGSIDASCYRDGKLLAVKTDMAPGQKATFNFHPRIYVGVVSQVQEGEIMNSAILSQVNTEINLFGLNSADLVMTGGGTGPNSTPFTFTLENVNKS